MNILILTDKYPPDVGGLAVSTRRLARGLKQAGQAAWVSVPDASVEPGGSMVSDDDGVLVYRVGAHRRADDALSDWFDHVLSLHARHHFDLIHAMYLTQPAFVAVMAGRYLDLPSVVSARGNDLDRTAFDPAKFSQVVWALQQASAVTVVTSDLQRKALAFAPGCRAHFIPNGVDTALFAPAPRSEAMAESLGLGNGLVIGFVGEARQKKGLTTLLPAFASLRAQFPGRLALLLVGGVRKDDAPIVQVFQKQNPRLDICIVPNVPHEQLPAYYSLIDVLAIPSLRDGMPNSLLEGMACQRAIVASNVGGIPDVLRQRGVEDGALVPPGDVAALAEAMQRLLADPAWRARLGSSARATVEAGFTPEKEIERNLDIYRDVMGKA